MVDQAIYKETLKFFLAPIRQLLKDKSVTEVMVNGPSRIYYEREGKIYRSKKRFRDEAALMAAIQNVAEYVDRRIDEDHPSMDARLPNGSRVHAIIPPSSRKGPCLTIRKFQKSKMNVQALIDGGTLTDEAGEFLKIAVQLHKNIVVSGGTGTGKTTMLNALSTAIPEAERIVVIEDSSELRLQQKHTVYLEAQPSKPNGRGGVTIRDLFVDSLRMRPDRIIVGEVRRGEALDLIQSMISGHAGSLTTVHANTPADAASRLETLCMMSDTPLPIDVMRSQVASAVNLVVQLSRMSDGVRRIESIAELVGLDSDQRYEIRELFRFQSQGVDEEGKFLGDLEASGAKPTFANEPVKKGLSGEVQASQNLFRERQ